MAYEEPNWILGTKIMVDDSSIVDLGKYPDVQAVDAYVNELVDRCIDTLQLIMNYSTMMDTRNSLPKSKGRITLIKAIMRKYGFSLRDARQFVDDDKIRRFLLS